MDEGKKWHQDWRALAFALFVSCVGILVSFFVIGGYHPGPVRGFLCFGMS